MDKCNMKSDEKEENIVKRLLWIATILWILAYIPITAIICFIHGVNICAGLGDTKIVDELMATRRWVSDHLWEACQKYGMG